MRNKKAFKEPGQPMCADKRRYFIELQMDTREPVPRNREAQVRRAQAEKFIGHMSQWLQEEALKDKVASMAITALGQVLITCEQDVIGKIQETEKFNIAAVRSGTSLTGSLQRIVGW